MAAHGFGFTAAISIDLCLLVMSLSCVSGSRVLISSMYGGGSHLFLGAAIGEGLVDRGHNATMLISRAYEHRVRDPRYSNLSFEVFDHRTRSIQDVLDFWDKFGDLSVESGFMYKSVQYMIDPMAVDCEDILHDVELLKRLEDVDAIVVDMTWLCGFMIRAALERNLNHTKEIRLVTLTPFTPQPISLFSYGSPYHPAFQPELNTGFTNRMTFIQRVTNLLQSMILGVMGGVIAIPSYQRVGKNTGLEVMSTEISNFHYLTDLHLLNCDFAIEFPFPVSPNVIPIGGGLTARPPAPLNKEFEDFMSSSGEHGVILFTLGTYFGDKVISQPGFAEHFVEAFRKLPQNVIWQLKIKDDDVRMLRVPLNVKIMPWVPLNDLLGHPKTRLFLSQGGNNGFQEACYHGVPLMVIPLQVDQFDVAARVVARGMGRSIRKSDVNADVVYETLRDVINDPKYRTVAKEVSAIIRSRPMGPRERAAFWIEHVIKYGGQYRKTPARELSLIEVWMLDVYFFLLAIAAIVLFIGFIVIRQCLSLSYRMCFGSVKSKLE